MEESRHKRHPLNSIIFRFAMDPQALRQNPHLSLPHPLATILEIIPPDSLERALASALADRGKNYSVDVHLVADLPQNTNLSLANRQSNYVFKLSQSRAAVQWMIQDVTKKFQKELISRMVRTFPHPFFGC